MNKLLRILRILIVILFVLIIGFIIYGKINKYRYLNSGNSFILENTNTTIIEESKTDIDIVQITVGDHTGTGLVWEKNADEIVFVSNGHLLENDSNIKIIFESGNRYDAEMIKIVNDYDIGFIKVQMDELDEKDKHIECVDKYEVNTNDTEYIQKLIDDNKKVFHIGVNTKRASDDEEFKLRYEGNVIDYQFIPEFYEMMIITDGYSKPGMSGGAVITEDGKLIGLLSGGKEATYSIPVTDIIKAWQ